MNCPTVTTLEQAEKTLPSTVLPIKGLRRDGEANLTSDALTMIIDGLKSRGVDPTDADTKKELTTDLGLLLCSVNQQYQFLLKELGKRVAAGKQVEKEFVDNIHGKNLFMADILNVSRHINGLAVYDSSSSFIEGWQNMTSTPSNRNSVEGFLIGLTHDRSMLESKSYLELQKQMVTVSAEKNKSVSNTLGMYGFLNLVAIGLIIYVAGMRHQ
jgi:hypothetical protein